MKADGYKKLLEAGNRSFVTYYSPKAARYILLPQTWESPNLATLLLHLSLTWIPQLTSESEIETQAKVSLCLCASLCVLRMWKPNEE